MYKKLQENLPELFSKINVLKKHASYFYDMKFYEGKILVHSELEKEGYVLTEKKILSGPVNIILNSTIEENETEVKDVPIGSEDEQYKKWVDRDPFFSAINEKNNIGWYVSLIAVIRAGKFEWKCKFESDVLLEMKFSEELYRYKGEVFKMSFRLKNRDEVVVFYGDLNKSGRDFDLDYPMIINWIRKNLQWANIRLDDLSEMKVIPYYEVKIYEDDVRIIQNVALDDYYIVWRDIIGTGGASRINDLHNQIKNRSKFEDFLGIVFNFK